MYQYKGLSGAKFAGVRNPNVYTHHLNILVMSQAFEYNIYIDFLDIISAS